MARLSSLLAVVASVAMSADAGATVRAPAPGNPAVGQVIRVGQSRDVRSLRQAAEIARDGDTVEIDAGDYKGDTAVWTQNQLVIRGIGGRPRIVGDGTKAAEGKGLFVVRGGNITIENLGFIGARVPDRNGAGVRLEKGRLIVAKCVFEDNENGILTGNASDIELHIVDSTFRNNGAGDGYSHNLYAGTIAMLHVTGSYFGPARTGHLLKSRARATTIYYSRLTGEGGSASYEMDIPNGGRLKAIGNLVQQGSQSENRTMISYGAEGYKWPDNHAYIAFNTLINDQASGVFVEIRSGPSEAVIQSNILVGRGDIDAKGTAVVKGNVQGRRNDFVDPSKFDYRIRLGSPLAGSAGAAGAFNQDDRPTGEYRHTASSERLTGMTELTPLSPGAFQRLAR